MAWGATLQGRPWCREHLVNAHPIDFCPEWVPVNSIAIPQEIVGRTIPRERLCDLTCRPFGSGMGGNVEMQPAPPIVRQDDENI